MGVGGALAPAALRGKLGRPPALLAVALAAAVSTADRTAAATVAIAAANGKDEFIMRPMIGRGGGGEEETEAAGSPGSWTAGEVDGSQGGGGRR